MGDFDDDGITDVAAGGSSTNTGTPPNPEIGVWALRTVLSPIWWENQFGEYGNAMDIAELTGDAYEDVITVASIPTGVGPSTVRPGRTVALGGNG